MVKAELRVKSAGTKLTEAEYAQLEAAKASGRPRATGQNHHAKTGVRRIPENSIAGNPRRPGA